MNRNFIKTLDENISNSKKEIKNVLIPILIEEHLIEKEEKISDNGIISIHIGTYKEIKLAMSICCNKVLTEGSYAETILLNEETDEIIYIEEFDYTDVQRFETLEELLEHIKNITNMIKSIKVYQDHLIVSK